MAKAKTDTTPAEPFDVVSALATADLATLDAQIVEREQRYEKLAAEIKSLRTLRRMADAFQNGAPLRKKPQRKKGQAAADDDTSRDSSNESEGAVVKAVRLALEELGAALVPAIAKKSGLSVGTVSNALQSDRTLFKNEPGGVWKLR